MQLLVFSLSTLLLHLYLVLAHPGISTDIEQQGNGLTQISSNMTWAIVQFPSWIKENNNPPDWAENWEDLEFATPDPSPWDISYPSTINNETIMRMYVYSMVSGTVIQNWNDVLTKRDDIFQMLDNFWETGSDEVSNLNKRWSISHARAWISSNSHKAKAVAMGSLISIVSGCSTHVIALGRRAICGSADGKQACLSWNGGDHTMKCSIAAQIIKDARGGLGEFGDISAHCAKAFYDAHGHASGACVSNRPDSCHG